MVIQNAGADAETRASLAAQLLSGLTAEPRCLPSLCLWDQRGLQLFEDITHSEDYYPFAAETSLLQENVDDILAGVSEGSVLLELGSGSLEKTAILLQGLSRLQRRVDYYALDVSPRELYRTLDALQGKIGHDSVVKCHPLICTYEEGISWLRQASVLHGRDVYVLWLGSSMANEAPRENQRLLKAFKVASDARQIGKFTFLVGIDSCRDVDRICRAYDLGNGLSRQFVMNGITNVNTTMGYDVFDPEDWVFRGFWNSRQSRYETCLSPVCNVAVRIGPQTVHLEGGELVRLIYSQKWRREDLDRILQGTGLGITGCWSSSDVAYSLYQIA